MSEWRETSLSRREFLCAAGTTVAAAALGGTPPEESPAPGPHEALFYEPAEDGNVRCVLCPWSCVVPDGQRGKCRVRENRKGKYYSLVYGRPVAVNPRDPIEKKPIFHVRPGSKTFSIATVGCNFHCRFCQNWDIAQANPNDVAPRYFAPDQIAKMAQTAECPTVAYTYNEPIIFYEYMSDCARAAKELGLANVMISNGFIRKDPLEKLLPLLTAVKVDLKAFTQDFYEKVCAGQLQPVLDTLKRIAGSGTWLEIVVLTIPTLNDQVDDVKRMAAWVVKELGPEVPMHFTRFHPDYKLRNLPATPPKTLEAVRQAAIGQGCQYVYGGNLPGMLGENTYCPKCKTLVIDRYHFTLEAFRLDGGKCPKCGHKIPGIWK